MNIGALAEKTSVSTDTIRFYEKQGLLDKPVRQANGYRLYRKADELRLNFIRSAHALGFSLEEIRRTLPLLNAGQLSRTQIEGLLHEKIAAVDKQIRTLRNLKRGLAESLAKLSCPPDRAVKDQDITQKRIASRTGVLFRN